MRLVTVGIAELKVSSDPRETLITYALGSCIAVTTYDPRLRVAGMIHFMLPLSSTSPEKARNNPAMFGDRGIPLLFEEMYRKGCKKQGLIVTVAGGGNVQDPEGVFNIGGRNYTVVRKLFWKNSVLINAEDVGGRLSRTVSLRVGDGLVSVRAQGQESVLWSSR